MSPRPPAEVALVYKSLSKKKERTLLLSLDSTSPIFSSIYKYLYCLHTYILCWSPLTTNLKKSFNIHAMYVWWLDKTCLWWQKFSLFFLTQTLTFLEKVLLPILFLLCSGLYYKTKRSQNKNEVARLLLKKNGRATTIDRGKAIEILWLGLRQKTHTLLTLTLYKLNMDGIIVLSIVL